MSSTDTEQPYSLKGGRVESRLMEEEMIEAGSVLHMFIHFTLGYPFDTISPEIFVFDITEDLQKAHSFHHQNNS